MKSLSSDDVQYLALEGGGGQGFAHVGAVQALQDLTILTFLSGMLTGQVKGFCGVRFQVARLYEGIARHFRSPVPHGNGI